MQLYTEKRGRGPDLVMLHGWGANAAIFKPITNTLAEAFTVTAIDLPGHGLSPATEAFGLNAWTDAVLEVAPAKAHWFGWSLGGLIALNAARLASERIATLALVSASPRFTFDNDSHWHDAIASEVLQAFRIELEQDADSAHQKFFKLQTQGADDERRVWNELSAQVLGRGQLSPEALAEGLSILESTDLRDAVAQIETPALLVSGGRDALVPAAAGRQLAQAMPNGKWVLLEEAAHLPFLTRWGTLEPIYTAFCRAAETGSEPVTTPVDPLMAYGIDQSAVKRKFNAAANSYRDAAVVHRAVRDDMLERLGFLEINPEHVIDLGAGPGDALPALASQYPAATIHAVDLAENMLAEVPDSFGRVVADALALPFANNTVELIFSNLLLHYCGDPEPVFREARRVLKQHGCFVFSTFGPDTLVELRKAWAAVDNAPHVIQFIDMHDIGDAIVRAGLQEPVLDVARYTVTYADLHALVRDLRAIGATNPLVGRSRGLTGRQKLIDMAAAYELFRQDGRLPATFEVVFGQAWVGREPDGAVGIPLEGIGRRQN